MSAIIYKKILVVSDNGFLIREFHKMITQFAVEKVDYACSPSTAELFNDATLPVSINTIKVKEQYDEIIAHYDLVFSLHCKQLFPAQLVSRVKCINVHPGYNPYNRGWYPQVFSILNGLQSGATIHEIDELLDHGKIIARREVKIEGWDTSVDAYNKIQKTEVDLLKENLSNILYGTYPVFLPEEEGNINLKKDFNDLCTIDLQKKVTMQQAIDYLRAMTHGKYKNAHYIDADTGKKVYVKIELEPRD